MSRIVPLLKPGAGVVTSRGDVHYVVTEYGVAHLFGRSLRERAERLIAHRAPEVPGGAGEGGEGAEAAVGETRVRGGAEGGVALVLRQPCSRGPARKGRPSSRACRRPSRSTSIPHGRAARSSQARLPKSQPISVANQFTKSKSGITSENGWSWCPTPGLGRPDPGRRSELPCAEVPTESGYLRVAGP